MSSSLEEIGIRAKQKRLSLVHKMRGKYIANVDDIRPQFRTHVAFLS